MSAHYTGHWSDLFYMALSIIDQAAKAGIAVDDWTFGGGTALMLQIDHRDSHDIDIFIQDPQYLPFLNPVTQEYDLKIMPSTYEQDGNASLKINYKSLGEIDFICCAPVSSHAHKIQEVCGREVRLETVTEIICKKIHYRGKRMQPRDMFDIAAASTVCGDETLVEALLSIPASCSAAAAAAGRIEPELVQSIMQKLQVRPEFQSIQDDAQAMTIKLLQAVAQADKKRGS